jgi:hypothetical protein
VPSAPQVLKEQHEVSAEQWNQTLYELETRQDLHQLQALKRQETPQGVGTEPPGG